MKQKNIITVSLRTPSERKCGETNKKRISSINRGESYHNLAFYYPYYKQRFGILWTQAD
jgi:hypothetical protein